MLSKRGRGAACVGCLLLLALPSCVRPFRQTPMLSVVPEYVCPGSLVTISWDAHHNSGGTGRRSRLTLGSGPPSGVDDPDGSVQVMISMSTLISFTTTDSNGERSATPQEVDLIPSDGAAFRIEGSPDCGAGVVSLTRNWPDQFDPRIRVTVVSVGNPGRTITVHHTDLEGASRTVPLPGGTSTPVFEGMTVGGHWVISSTLAINESCSGAEGSVVPDTTRVTAPTSLLASVSAICRNQ